MHSLDVQIPVSLHFVTLLSPLKSFRTYSPLLHHNVQLVACVAAPLVGDLLDSAPRVPALTAILVTQSSAIMVGAAATMHALHLAFPDAEAAAAAAGTPGTSALCVLPAAAVLQQGWFVVVVVAGAVERLMGLATGVAVEIDWVLVVRADNSVFVSAESVQGAALFPVPMSAASCVVDAAACTVPSKEPARLELSPTIMRRAESACDITPIAPTSPARVTVTTALLPSLSPAEGILWRYTQAVEVSGLAVGAAAGAAASAVGRAAGKGLRVFMQEAVMPASMAYVLLCFNAMLAPGVLMTSFLFHHGPFLCLPLPPTTLIASSPPPFISAKSLYCNLFSHLWVRLICASCECACRGGHGGDRRIQQRRCCHGLRCVLRVACTRGTPRDSAAHSSLFFFHPRPLLTAPPCRSRQAGSIALLFQATMLALSVLDFSSLPLCPPFLYQGLLMLFLLLLVLSRIGQGVYQIVGCQIIQAVPAASANLFGTTEMALSSLAELAMLTLAIVFHDPKYFGALVLISWAGVLAAAVLYCSWLAFPDPRLQTLFPTQPKVQWGTVFWWGMGQEEKTKGKGYPG
ncbi:unnamed protein product [Closterium sp. Yama58-4]|nr:unnamed protein product [Closterium sp. Yama58-4]